MTQKRNKQDDKMLLKKKKGLGKWKIEPSPIPSLVACSLAFEIMLKYISKGGS